MDGFLTLVFIFGLLTSLCLTWRTRRDYHRQAGHLERLQRDLDELRAAGRPATSPHVEQTETPPLAEEAKEAGPALIVPTSVSAAPPSPAPQDSTPPPIPVSAPGAAKRAAHLQNPSRPPLEPVRSKNPRPAVSSGPSGMSFRQRLRPWLQRLHLLPPQGKTRSEAGVAAWWTTRVGVLLGVIAVVFLGVYVNRVTEPWIRFIELLGISLTVFALGWRLEKRWGRLGDLVCAGGLAMLYFTAYGAHGVAAVRITSEPWLGALLQGAALIGMLGWSLYRADPRLGAAAIGLGYVTCAFTLFHGLPMMMLTGLFFLALAAGLLLVLRAWRMPVPLAIAGSYGGLLALALASPWPVPLAPFLTVGVLLIAVFSGALALAGQREKGASAWLDRCTSAHGAGAVLSLVGGTWILDFASLDLVYLILTLTFTIHAFLSWRGRLFPHLFPLWFLKALSFLALYLAIKIDGPALWLSLTLQSVGLLWVMRQREAGRRWMAIAFFGLWAAAYSFFLRSSPPIILEPGAFAALPRTGLSFLYLLIATLTATLYREGWWCPGKTVSRWGGQLALVLGTLSGIGLAIAVFEVAWRVGPLSHVVLTLMSLFAAALLLLMARRRRQVLPLLTAAFVLTARLFSIATTRVRSGGYDLITGTYLGPLSVLLVAGLGYLVAREILRIRRASTPSQEPLPALPVLAAIVTFIWSFVVMVNILILTEFAVEGSYLSCVVVLSAALMIMSGSRKLLAVPSTGSVVGSGKSVARTFHALLLVATGAAVTAVVLDRTVSAEAPWFLLAVCGAIGGWAALRRDPFGVLTLLFPGAISLYVYYFPRHPITLGEDLALGGLHLFGILLGAVILGRLPARVEEKKDAALSIGHRFWMDFALQTLGLILIHQLVLRHFPSTAHWLVMTALVPLLILPARRLPFPSLSLAVWVPLLPLMLGHSLPSLMGTPLSLPPVFWIGTALLILGWRLQRTHLEVGLSFTAVALAWTALLTLHFTNAALAISLSGLGYAFLWRFRREPQTPVASVLLAGLAFYCGCHALTFPAEFPGELFLASVLGTAGALVIQGTLLKSALRHPAHWREPLHAWGHALGGLCLAFYAFVTPQIAPLPLATAFWALASILLFITGLRIGLRSYRLIGLLGLLACTTRVFAVDAQDTFYRIIAFAVTAVILVAVGYLYTRFRSWIEAHDDPPSSTDPPASTRESLA